MRKTLIVAIAAAVALATAAIAMAAVYTASGSAPRPPRSSTDKVSLRSASCTGGDGKAFTITQGRYTGTATFAAPAAELSGPLDDRRPHHVQHDGRPRLRLRLVPRQGQPARSEPPRRPVHRHPQGQPARRLPDGVGTWPPRPRARQPECDVRSGHGLHRRRSGLDQLDRSARRGRRPDLPEAEARTEAQGTRRGGQGLGRR